MTSDNVHASRVAEQLAMADENPTTVYLAGPVGHSPDEPSRWRDLLIEEFGETYDFRDPLGKYDLSVEDLQLVDGTSDPDNPTTVGIEEIVETDKRLIDESDGLIVGYSAVRQIGTPMEVMYAHERDYPIALWVRDDTEFDELSPWYRYHATALTTDPAMALRHIDRQTREVATV